jgi:hypothetical protein
MSIPSINEKNSIPRVTYRKFSDNGFLSLMSELERLTEKREQTSFDLRYDTLQLAHVLRDRKLGLEKIAPGTLRTHSIGQTL